MTTRGTTIVTVVGIFGIGAALGGGALALMDGPVRSGRPQAATVPVVTEPKEEPTGDRAAPVWRVDLEGAASAARTRTAAMALAPVNGREQRVEVRYDVDAVTRPTSLERVAGAPDWEAGVRLLLGEVGAWRLAASRWGLLEGVGILETVHNRFDPDLANPLRIDKVASWPGCGAGALFATCIDPGQYRGMDSARALRPREAVPDAAELNAGLDRAVLAWFVFEEALLGEITSGATSFVHLCGGPAYGEPSEGCAEAGGDPHRGPAAFRGPSAWLSREGRYALDTLATVDFEEGAPPTTSRAYVDYLLSGGRR